MEETSKIMAYDIIKASIEEALINISWVKTDTPYWYPSPCVADGRLLKGRVGQRKLKTTFTRSDGYQIDSVFANLRWSGNTKLYLYAPETPHTISNKKHVQISLANPNWESELEEGLQKLRELAIKNKGRDGKVKRRRNRLTWT